MDDGGYVFLSVAVLTNPNKSLLMIGEDPTSKKNIY